ncbi:MAG: hypothetical protein ACRDZ8_10765 [Acidimicrobiales bacterium]
MPVIHDAPSFPDQSAPEDRPTALDRPVAIAVFAVAAALLIWEARFRVIEASVSAWTIRLFRVRPARSLGPDVIFPLGHRWVGFALTLSCTSALLMVPFFVIAGVLLLFRRVPRRRALVALAVAAAVLFAINQLRLVVIAASMLWWGFETGYQRSHVLLGTTLSTIGVIIGIIIFVWMLVEDPSRRTRRTAS